MKARKLYEVRHYPDVHPMQPSDRLSFKLRPYQRARRLARYVKARYGLKTFVSPLSINI